MNRPSVPEVGPLVRALYRSDRHHGAGGHLHLILDEPNHSDDAVDYCMQYAKEQGCTPCYHLALIMRQMTRTQRSKLSRYA